MGKFKDILLNEKGELMIISGDIVIGDSDEQHIIDICDASMGYYKQEPLVGANVRSMMNGELGVVERRNIRLQLVADGYNVKNVSFIDGILDIQAER